MQKEPVCQTLAVSVPYRLAPLSPPQGRTREATSSCTGSCNHQAYDDEQGTQPHTHQAQGDEATWARQRHTHIQQWLDGPPAKRARAEPAEVELGPIPPEGPPKQAKQNMLGPKLRAKFPQLAKAPSQLATAQPQGASEEGDAADWAGASSPSIPSASAGGNTMGRHTSRTTIPVQATTNTQVGQHPNSHTQDWHSYRSADQTNTTTPATKLAAANT